MATWNTDDDTSIYYEIHGDDSARQSLLLLPGLLGTVQTHWQKFLDPLARQFRVVLMELRGHGRSGNNANALTAARMTQDVAGLLNHLNIEQTHIAGYSLGGYLGLLLHLQQPERVQTLLMHATKFYWTPEVVAGMTKQLDPEKIAAKVPKYAQQLAGEHGEDRWRDLLREASGFVENMLSDGIIEAVAARAVCPILVSVGDRDELIPVAEALTLSRALPNGSLIVLPNVKHPLPGVPLTPLLPMMLEFHSQA